MCVYVMSCRLEFMAKDGYLKAHTYTHTHMCN